MTLEIPEIPETQGMVEMAEMAETPGIAEILEMLELVVIQGTTVPRDILQTSAIFLGTYRPNLVQQKQLYSRGSIVKSTAKNRVPNRRRNSHLESHEYA